MAGDQSEEKTLPASKKKIDDARKKGQVARSKDLTVAAGLIGGAGFLLLGAGTVVGTSAAMFTAAGDAAGGDFALGLRAVGGAVRTAVLAGVVPVLGLVPALVVLSALVMLRGVPFATDPITPKFENVSPVEGFKKLFKLRTLIELVKSLVKVAVLGAILLCLLAGGVNALVLAPGCGLGCVRGVFAALIGPLLGATCVLFLVAGLADVGLQGWLFRRDQKMSVSEAKRERKDTDGDPALRRERRRLIREAATGPARLGVAMAGLLVHDGGATVVGLRFRRGETPVPMVVCRGRNARAGELMAEARRLRVPLAEDAELARALAKQTPPGQFIPEQFYRATALLLSQVGLV